MLVIIKFMAGVWERNFYTDPFNHDRQYKVCCLKRFAIKESECGYSLLSKYELWLFYRDRNASSLEASC